MPELKSVEIVREAQHSYMYEEWLLNLRGNTISSTRLGLKKVVKGTSR
jgi:hypothetical protein